MFRTYDSGLMEAPTATSYPGAHPKQACTRKKGYPTERVAKSVMALIRETNPDARVRVYACTFCGCWHVGGEPGARDMEETQRSSAEPRTSRRFGSFADYRRRDLGRKVRVSKRRRDFDDDFED